MPSQTPRTVVIAGASSGIGLATALAFARTGAHLYLLARRADALEEAARECEAEGSPHAVAVPGDVADAAALATLARRAVEETGRLDVWVNMAGVGALGRFEEVPIEVHRRILDTNLTGVMNGCHAALPHMLARDAGVIVNMGSIGSRLPQPFAAAYAASKWGLAGFTDSLRFEVLARSRVQVCGIYPTVVDTPAVHHAGNWTGRVLDRMPPAIAPERVAQAVLAVAARPRRAVRLGAEQVLIPAFWLAPELNGRAFGRLAQRSLYRRGQRGAAPTPGALLTPVAQGRSMRLGGAVEARRRIEAGAIGLAAGLAALAGLAFAMRRR